MGFQEWESKIDNRISKDIIAEFKEAVRELDIAKMNSLHQEWNMFFEGADKENNFVFAKIEDGVMTLPEAVLKTVNKEARYKWILKDTGSLYLVKKTPEAKYMEDAVRTSAGKCIDERLMYVKDIIAFDDAMQSIFKWKSEDIAVIHIFMDGIRIDKF